MKIKQIIPSKTAIKRKTALSKIIETKGMNISKCLKEADYSDAYAHNPQDFMNTKAVKKELDWLKYEQEQIRLRMEKTRNKAKYKELSDTYVGLSKINQLLGGNPTERIQISEEDKRMIDEAFKS